MKLKALHFKLNWPEGFSSLQLRSLVIGQVRKYGEPLRWAITKVDPGESDLSSRLLSIEAVVIDNEIK